MDQLDIIDFSYQPDAGTLFEKIRKLPTPVWLDSGKPDSLYGDIDIISAAPDTLLETVGGRTSIRTSNTSTTENGDPFALAEQLVHEFSDSNEPQRQPLFNGGLIGYWGYQLNHRFMDCPISEQSVFDFPDMHIGRYLWALIINHATHKAQLVFHQTCPAWLKRDVQMLLKEARQSTSFFELLTPFEASESREQYQQALEKIHQYILDGDCYQVNYAQHFSANFSGDPWEAYQLLRRVLPSPFSAYIELDAQKSLLSISPERFIKLSGRQIETKPIKGTAKRGHDLEQDHRNAVRLQNSTKDRAENLMIVDLLRNDLGKSCQPGSIKVPALFSLESYANVHHLVSTVTGTLNKNVSPLKALQNAFPGGSVTGAPKKRAIEIIHELEQQPRAVYCGSVGYLGFNGRMDTNIAIRTFIASDQQLHCWGGGGIVADSQPELEYQESLDKIAPLMQALETTLNRKSDLG